MRILHVFLALCLVPMEIATAQSVSTQWPLDSGSRVRIQAPIFSDKTQQGTVTSTQADTLRFRAWRTTASTAVGVKDISRIDVFQGTHSRKIKGTVIGFALGAGLAAGITAATWKKPTNCGLCMDFDQEATRPLWHCLEDWLADSSDSWSGLSKRIPGYL